MRKAIDNYAMKNQRPPQSLKDLIEGGFLYALPVDPITHKADWVVKIGDVEINARERAKGIVDVRSNSSKISSTGDQYYTW